MKKILVVDDDADVRSTMEEMLRTKGYQVQAYEDPSLAFEGADPKNFDLILTDLKMSMGGDEFILHLKQKKIDIPVIVVSGYLSEDQIAYLAELGVKKVLHKPLRMSELLHEVEAILFQ